MQEDQWHWQGSNNKTCNIFEWKLPQHFPWIDYYNIIILFLALYQIKLALVGYSKLMWCIKTNAEFVLNSSQWKNKCSTFRDTFSGNNYLGASTKSGSGSHILPFLLGRINQTSIKVTRVW